MPLGTSMVSPDGVNVMCAIAVPSVADRTSLMLGRLWWEQRLTTVTRSRPF